jgi:hypothetical protein
MLWVPLLLWGCLAIALSTPARAQRLPAPPIFDDDIPSAPVPETQTFPQQGSPELPPAPSSDRVIEFTAPQPLRTPNRSSRVYRVEIYGDSPLLLAQVQRLERRAFVRRGEGIIQVGEYTNEADAQQRVSELEQRGIIAQITAVYVDAGATETERQNRSRAYFVVIPTGRSDLGQIRAKVIGLGFNREAVLPREGPRGSHLAVGPFKGRTEAERWSSYLQGQGMDARVYFGR